MLKTRSLTKAIIGSYVLEDGVISHPDGSLSRGFELTPISSGILEEGFDGDISDAFFTKLSDLLTRLPNLFEGQIILCRRKEALSTNGFVSTILAFEKVPKIAGYSHLKAVFNELKMEVVPITNDNWRTLLATLFGNDVMNGVTPDLTWEKEYVRTPSRTIRALSLTELPQITWKGCFQPLFESPDEFVLSIRIKVPDRNRMRKQLETKRRVSHALSISSSLEVRNIESNSVLSSSEETLERMLVGKESLFEMSFGILLSGDEESTISRAHELERLVSGVGNAGLFIEGIGTLPILQSHLPGNRMLSIRTLPILSENLSHILPVIHDYSRANEPSSLTLQSRTGEISNLNLFSKENLNFNAFICGASGSGKSFLMNAILSSLLKDEPKARLCIFDVGGSYRRIIESQGGKTTQLDHDSAAALISTFLKTQTTNAQGFFRSFLETLCGSGSHITHSHSVAIEDLLQECAGEPLEIRRIIQNALKRGERYYQDIAHWLKPHTRFDSIPADDRLVELIRSPIASFDFKSLDSDPVLQKTTILLLTELLWRDLVHGRHPKTLIVFDEVWRFFAQSRGFLEEMYRTLRKYKAGIVSITQNLADYGDESFAKMLFTNSLTKIFLQNGASAEFLKNTFDLAESDIERALSATSSKPIYSEFFALTPVMSQVFRLYPSQDFYALANTENVAIQPERKDEA